MTQDKIKAQLSLKMATGDKIRWTSVDRIVQEEDPATKGIPVE